MTKPITFYLSFGSPFSYFAAQRIDELATKHKRQVRWRPVRLKNVLDKVYGKEKFSLNPIKLTYFRHDSKRMAAIHKLPFYPPDEKPPFDCNEAYTFSYTFSDGDETKLRAVSLALVSAVWSKGIVLKTSEDMASALADFHLPRKLVKSCASSSQGREAHELAISEAIESGMFGAPWFVVDGEVFWGNDRIDIIDIWLSK